MTDTAVAEKKDVVPSTYREKYKESGGTCGDFVAGELQRIAKDGIESLVSVQVENGIEATRWADFNPGMRRMNLANVLRGRFLKGETIIVLGKHYNAVDMAKSEYDNIPNDHKFMLKLAKFLDLQENDRTANSLTALFFPKAKGPTAEERAAVKADKAAAKAQEKADKAAAKAQEKADKAAAKEADKVAKAAAKAAEKAAVKAE